MRTRFVATAAVASLVIAGLTGSALADAGDAPAPGARAAAAAQDARADQAETALAEVAELFGDTPAGSGEAPAAPRAGAAAEAHGRDATMALRDLAFLKDSLTGEDRAAAERYLARPTQMGADPQGDGYTVAEATPRCGLNVCVHYVATTADAPLAGDTAPADGIPDYVEFALDTLENVHTTYALAELKEPKDDTTSTPNGGNGLTDVYLKDLDQLYGYCTTDDPTAGNQDVYDVSAYCVLDNDYLEFLAFNTSHESLQVTAAHEYFHAVQYAYDWLEDGWFMEASATWAEDELYDSVNDNVGYLDNGQLGEPWVPLDYYGGLTQYGNWIFLRYLTEKYPAEVGGLPKLMRDILNRVDAAELTDPDMYAIQAIKSALSARNTSFTTQYALFTDAGRRRSSFSEGVAQQYPIKPLGGTRTLSSANKTTGWLEVTGGQDHLTSLTLRVVPNDSLKASAWRLRVQLDLAPTRRGSAAVVTVYKQGGGVTVTRVPLSAEGNKSLSVRFGKSDVKYVEITTTNASTRFDCWIPPYDSPYSCVGESKDDNIPTLLKATAFR